MKKPTSLDFNGSTLPVLTWTQHVAKSPLPSLLVTAASSRDTQKWLDVNPWAKGAPLLRWTSSPGEGVAYMDPISDDSFPSRVCGLARAKWPGTYSKQDRVRHLAGDIATLGRSARFLARFLRMQRKSVMEVCAEASQGVLALGFAAGGAEATALCSVSPSVVAAGMCQHLGVNISVEL